MSNARVHNVAVLRMHRRHSPQPYMIAPATHSFSAQRVQECLARGGRRSWACRRSYRSGATLIEAVAAATLASFIAGMGAVFLGQMLRGEVRAREHVHRLSALGRVSARLREDAGQAAQALLPNDGSSAISPRQGAEIAVLTLVLQSNEQVEYLARPDGLYRVVRYPGGARRERYSLARGWSCTVRVEEQQKTRWLILTLRTPPDVGEAWECSIEALLAASPKRQTAEGLP